jgi:hypothetical protein
MPKNRLLSQVVLVSTCWLVLLASGDDINVARFVLPPTDSSVEHVMPFDDPNFDFTQPSAPPTLQQGQPAVGPNLFGTASRRQTIHSEGFCTPADHHLPLRC